MGVCCSLVFRRRRAQRSVLDGWLEGRLGAGEVPAGGGRRWRRRQIGPDYPVHSGQSAFSFCSESRKSTQLKRKARHGSPSKRIPGTGFFTATLPRPTTLHWGVVGECRAEARKARAEQARVADTTTILCVFICARKPLPGGGFQPQRNAAPRTSYVALFY